MERNSENPIDIEISEFIPSGENELPIFDLSPEDSSESSEQQLSQEASNEQVEYVDESETRYEQSITDEKEGDELPVMEEEEEIGVEPVEDEEFIIDDYEVIEEGVFEIKEVIDLPENRIIATDEEQERELREDLLRRFTDKQKTTTKLQEINKTIHRFSKLKADYSNYENDEIIGPKTKGPEYRPLIETIKSGNFKDTFLSPVVFGKKILHESVKDDDLIVTEDDIKDSENVIAPEIKESVTASNDISEKYKKGTERLRYNLTKEIREQFNLMNGFDYGETDNGYKLSLKDRTHAIVNPYKKTKVYSNTLKVRDFVDDILFPGVDNVISYNPFTIQGILRKEPQLDVFYRYAPLFQIINNEEPVTYINELPPRVKLDESLEVNDNVNVCVPVQEEIITLPGKIIDITDEFYEIEPLKKADKDVYNTLKISLKNDKMLITKNTLIQHRDDNENCLLFENTIFQFPDNPIDTTAFERFMHQIIPSHKTIFYVNYPTLKSAQTLQEIENLLLSFGSSTKQITHESMMIARKFLNYNNEIHKAVYQTEYNTFRKNYKEPTHKYEKDKDVSLLSKKTLSRFTNFYDEYPDYGKVNDNLTNRLRWLLKRSDNGLLFYKNMSLDYLGKQRNGVTFQKTMLNSELNTKQILFDVYLKNVEKIKESIINKKAGECPEKRLVKRYISIEDMEFDINRQIFVDKEFLLFQEKKNPSVVEEGQYAILETPQGNEIWRRENIQGSFMWNKTNTIDGGHLLDSNIDYCNNQGKTLEMLENIKFNDPKRCSYSKLLEVCVDVKDFKTVQEFHRIKEQLDNINEQLSFLDNNENVFEKINATIEVLETRAENYLVYLAKMTALREAKAQKQEDRPEVDEVYGSIYRKIDLHKKNINTLPIENQYPLYKNLINKWGRPATEEENPINIYLKVGKKVLLCKHHEYFISFYETTHKNKQKNIYDNLVRDYGVTVNGYIVCTNCGQEIGIAEFETIEGFNESGAYNVTTEVLVVNQIEKENSEFVKQQIQYVTLIDSLMMPSAKKSKLDTSSKADVISVVKEYQTIMGITFKDSDHMSIIKQIYADIDVKQLNEWMKTLPAKIVKTKSRDALQKAYNKYNNIESIIAITASFMLLCQTSTPTPVITRAHKSCNLTFTGYPLLEKENKSAISTFVCMLKTLRESNSSIWKSLQKTDIEKKLVEAVEKLLKKPIYKKRILNKRTELSNESLDVMSTTYAEWNEFRPPLQTRKVNEASINKKKLSKHEKNYLYSLKTMEYIDSVVRNEEATSTLYEPVPLAQSCCHQKIDNGFSVMDYFNKDASDLISKSMKEIEPVILHGEKRQHSTYTFPFEIRKELLLRFDKHVFAEGDDLTPSSINEFFTHINTDELDPYFGESYLFVDGICIRSGKKKEDVVAVQYTREDYERIIERIHKKSLFPIYKNTKNEESFIDMMKQIGNENKLLGNRPEFKKFIKQYKSSKNNTELFETLELKTEVIVDTIINLLPIHNFNDNKRISIKKFIDTLGEHTSLYNESLLSMNKENATSHKYTKGKYTLYHFIVSFIPTILGLIKPFSEKDFNSYLYNRLRHDEITISQFNADYSNNCTFKDKTVKSASGISHTQRIVEIIDSMKSYSSIAFSIKEHIGFEETYIQEVYKSIELFKKPFEILRGFPVILDIEGNSVDESRITAKNIFIITKYILVILLLSLFQGTTATNDLVELADEQLSEPSDITNEDGLTETDASIILLDELDKERIDFFGSMFYSILESYNKHNEQLDFYTVKTMKLELAKDYDRKKNKNLQFYENLDKETAKSLKAMLQVGLESYKRDLSEARDYLLHDINTSIVESEYDQYEQNIDRPVITDEQRRIMDEGDFLPDDE